MARKTRTMTMGPRECGGCDLCMTAATHKVQISTPNGRSYRTAGLLCFEHKTAENIEFAADMAIRYLDDEE